MNTSNKKLLEARYDYTDEQNYAHIDGWFTDDDYEEGRTIAIVCRDTKKVYFIDNTLRGDEKLLDAISKVLSSIN